MGVIPRVGGDYTKGQDQSYQPREGLESVGISVWLDLTVQKQIWTTNDTARMAVKAQVKLTVPILYTSSGV